MGTLRLFILLLPACTTQKTDCSTLMPCTSGGYKLCQQGSLCWYQLTDGTTISCADCGNCLTAVDAVQNWCGAVYTEDMTPPVDMQSIALAPSAGLIIPKTGPPAGSMSNPGLNNLSDCPDAALEPNDGPLPSGQPLRLPQLVPDMPTPKIVKIAICPKGASPLTGRHDEDWFEVDNSGGSPVTLVAEAFYDVSLGDLDLAITDAAGNLLASDGTAVTNACAATAIGSGVYYVVVTGANDQAVNNYELLARTYTTSQACP